MKITFRLAALLAASIASVAAQAAPTIALVSGQPRTFNLAGNSFTNSFFIDVPESSQRLTITLTGGTGAGDLDLYLSSAAEFPDSVGGQPPTLLQLSDAAQYRSISVESSESLAISRANAFPVRKGRWFISVVNFDAPSAPTLTATLSDTQPGSLPIQVVFDDPSDDCSIAEWNNATSKAPLDGNPGNTLGTQRRNAVIEAARLISNQIKSDVPVRVQACWDNLGGGNSFTVAQAGPDSFLRGESWMPHDDTWYAAAPAGKLAGARYCSVIGGSCAQRFDLAATFNDRVDTSEIQSSFYYGYSSAAPFNTIDFIAVAMHEISHGLGFISSVNTRASNGSVGSKLQGFNDAFGYNLVDINPDSGERRRFMSQTDAERAASIAGVARLRWDDTRAVTSIANQQAGFGAPDSYIFMHTPDPIVPGSSLSHTGLRHNGDLMQAQSSRGQRTLQLAAPMLEALGWSQSAPEVVLPTSNVLYDVQRDGHGIQFQRVRDTIYILTFFTYDNAGQPEWYQALGNMQAGVFVPFDEGGGKTLIRFDYDRSRTPATRKILEQSGTVSLDFNNAGNQSPCSDGRNRFLAAAVMRFTLPGDTEQRWCMEPLVSRAAIYPGSVNGLWFGTEADSGWGWSLLQVGDGPTAGLFGNLYYYDANGNATWAYTQSGSIGGTVPVMHRRAYCRTCAAAPFHDTPAGTVRFTFTRPSEFEAAGNRVEFSATPQTPPGGTFARGDTPFVLLGTPE